MKGVLSVFSTIIEGFKTLLTSFVPRVIKVLLAGGDDGFYFAPK